MTWQTVEEVRDVWVVWTNSDLTEGKGYQYPLQVCASESTAIRSARGMGVMGSNATVRPGVAVRFKNQWMVPGVIERPSAEDEKADKRLEARRAAIAKARDAGLSEIEISLLGGGNG